MNVFHKLVNGSIFSLVRILIIAVNVNNSMRFSILKCFLFTVYLHSVSTLTAYRTVNIMMVSIFFEPFVNLLKRNVPPRLFLLLANNTPKAVSMAKE